MRIHGREKNVMGPINAGDRIVPHDYVSSSEIDPGSFVVGRDHREHRCHGENSEFRSHLAISRVSCGLQKIIAGSKSRSDCAD